MAGRWVLPTGEAEDAVQETFMALCNGRRSRENPSITACVVSQSGDELPSIILAADDAGI